MHVCSKCGNKELFKADREEWGRCKYSEIKIVLINSDGDEEEVIDYGDETHDDYDREDMEDTNVKCDDCDSEEILDLTEEDWEKWKHKTPINQQHNFNKEHQCFKPTPINNKLKNLKKELLK